MVWTLNIRAAGIKRGTSWLDLLGGRRRRCETHDLLGRTHTGSCLRIWSCKLAVAGSASTLSSAINSWTQARYCMRAR
jgi:hypothetical protein